MPIGAAIGAAAVVGAGASIYSSNKASKAQQQASEQANATQMQQYNQSRADLTPWRLTGQNALRDLSDLTGVAYNDGQTMQTGTPMPARQPRNQLQALMDSPGYQFRLAEGNKALDRSAAARGGLFSGATLKALSRYNQDYASNEYGNQWNRLASIAGVGQQATNQGVALGQSTANAVSNNLINAGNARASNYINTGNTIGGLASDAALAYGYYNRPAATTTTKPIR